MTWLRPLAILLFALVGVACVPVSPAAAKAACAGQGNLGAPPAVQERAMLCLVNRVRRSRGLEPLVALRSLTRAADRKSGDILRCGEFSHEACGLFQAWMHSRGHRENILGRYEDTGIGLRTGSLEGYGGANVGTEEFGTGNC